MTPLPVDPGWRATVEATIARLEGSTTLYDQLRLAGWRAHLETIKAAEAYWKEVEATHDDDAHNFQDFLDTTGVTS